MFKSKSVLIIGEEMLVLYASSGGKAKRVASIAWNEDNLVDRLAHMLVHNGKRRPVHILYDMLEQQYKKELVPQLSILDKSRYIDRKLKVVYPSNPMRAAYFLKGEAEEALREGKRRVNVAGNPYIFASVPDLPQLRHVYEALKKSELTIIGFGLLPIEGASMLAKISQALRNGPNAPKWAVMLAQHESGGLRQIVIKNGELALTRLTGLAASPDDDEEWGAEVGQEFKSTLSYLLRFGYTPDQGIDIYIVHGSDRAAEAFRREINIEANLVCKSMDQFSRIAGLRVASSHGSYSGDALHAAWASKVRGLRLPMKSLAFGRMVDTRRAAQKLSAGLMLLILAGAGYAAYLYQDAARARAEVAREQRHYAELQSQISSREEGLVKIDKDTDTILRILDVYESLEKNGVSSFRLANAISTALNQVDLKLDKLIMAVPEKEEGDAEAAEMMMIMDGMTSEDGSAEITQKIKPADVDITLEVSFPTGINPEEGVRKINAFKASLEDVLAGYDIQITQQVANLTKEADFSEDLATFINLPKINDGDEMSSGEDFSNADTEGEAVTAQILIKGPVQ